MLLLVSFTSFDADDADGEEEEEEEEEEDDRGCEIVLLVVSFTLDGDDDGDDGNDDVVSCGDGNGADGVVSDSEDGGVVDTVGLVSLGVSSVSEEELVQRVLWGKVGRGGGGKCLCAVGGADRVFRRASDCVLSIILLTDVVGWKR